MTHVPVAAHDRSKSVRFRSQSLKRPLELFLFSFFAFFVLRRSVFSRNTSANAHPNPHFSGCLLILSFDSSDSFFLCSLVRFDRQR